MHVSVQHTVIAGSPAGRQVCMPGIEARQAHLDQWRRGEWTLQAHPWSDRLILGSICA